MPIIVSIIIPTHNRAHLIKKAVFSALAQTFQAFEMIIVNDASSDETAKVLTALQMLDERIRVITNTTSLGGSGSRNKGIKASLGDWIAFLDDDDIWHPKKLQKQMEALMGSPEAVAANCFYTVNYPFKIKKTVATEDNISLEKLLIANRLGGTSVCIAKASILKTHQGFDARLKSAQDWDLWVKLRMQGKIITVKEALVDYFIHFNYRISNDMQAKYIGARRFYFKYKKQMSFVAKASNLRFICFIRSRQPHRSFKTRIHNLKLAINASSTKTTIAFLLSSLPRLLFDRG